MCQVKDESLQFNAKLADLAQAAGTYVYKNPEESIAAVVEFLIPIKAPSIAKLKQVQSLVSAVKKQDQIARVVTATSTAATKIATSIKEVIAEACAVANAGIEHGKTAMQNLINVAAQQPEITSVGDLVALRVPSECLKDVEKLSGAVGIARSEEAIRSLAGKISKVSNDLLYNAQKAGGHAIEEHVSKSVNYLTTRAAHDPKVDFASSFNDLRTASKAAQENLRCHAEDVARWLKSDSSDPKVLEFSHKYSVGYGVPKGNRTPIYDLKKSRIVLIKDATQELGFNILTTFPIVE